MRRILIVLVTLWTSQVFAHSELEGVYRTSAGNGAGYLSIDAQGNVSTNIGITTNDGRAHPIVITTPVRMVGHNSFYILGYIDYVNGSVRCRFDVRYDGLIFEYGDSFDLTSSGPRHFGWNGAACFSIGHFSDQSSWRR